MPTPNEYDPSAWTGELTEKQWHETTDAVDLIHHLTVVKRIRTVHGDHSAERKTRLFGVACCRLAQAWADVPAVCTAIDATERFADGLIPVEELRELQAAVERVGYPEPTGNAADPVIDTPALRVARAASLIARFDDGWVYYTHIREVLHELVQYGETREEKTNAATSANLLRDVFGNPFRPVSFDAAWRTPTAAALAAQMYELRDFGAMPILADALEDAGCDSGDVLAHCRDPHATHVRGCWVVDLVLGKE